MWKTDIFYSHELGGFQVGDVNDHAPAWNQPQYTVNLSEITAVDTTVLTLAAYDADSGENGLLTYRFTPQQADTSLGLFALNQSSGEVSCLQYRFGCVA